MCGDPGYLLRKFRDDGMGELRSECRPAKLFLSSPHAFERGSPEQSDSR